MKIKERLPELIGYCRVSTVSQNLKTQEKELQEAGCIKVYSDKITGTSKNRKGLTELFKYAIPGDTVVCTRIDRLGRNLRVLLDLFDDIINKGLKFKSLENGLVDPENYNNMMIFHMQCAMAEHDYKLIKMKTRKGIDEAMKENRMGRPHVYKANDIQYALDMRAENHSVKYICKKLNVPRRTYYNMIKHNPDTFIPRIKKR